MAQASAMARGVALLLTLLLATAGIAAGGRRGLRVLRSEVPDACDVRVGRGDSVAYHYSGRAAGGEGENGEMTIADTAIVGRPIEAVISGGEDRGLPAAIEEALVGACNGERRRVIVAPHRYRGGSGSNLPVDAEVFLDVHVLRINGVSHGLNRRAMTADAGASPHGAEECGACRGFSRAFVGAWSRVARRNAAEVQSRGGRELPALTYNQDLEDAVQGLCGGSDVAGTPLVRDFCARAMREHKRAIVQVRTTHRAHAFSVPISNASHAFTGRHGDARRRSWGCHGRPRSRRSRLRGSGVRRPHASVPARRPRQAGRM